MKAYSKDIESAIQVLKNGGIILYPTDTVWGIGCDATNSIAVSKIFLIKQRDDNKSMLVLMSHIDQLGKYVKEIPPMAADLIEFATKPLTIIYPGAVNFTQNLVGDDGSIGIRVVSDDFCRDLINKFGKPIVSTSANISGDPTPANYSEIDERVVNGVDYVVNWRKDDLSNTSPSGIIKLGLKGEVQVIRE